MGAGGNTTIENYPRILCRFFLNINSRDKKKIIWKLMQLYNCEVKKAWLWGVSDDTKKERKG